MKRSDERATLGAAASLEAACGHLTSHRYLAGTEAELQAFVERVLLEAAIPFERERVVGRAGRIDFYLPLWRAGLELKTEGSASAVLRQLHRYAGELEIERLFLGTTHARLGGLPAVIRGKPLQVLTLSGGWL